MSSILLSKSSAAQVVECPQGATFVFGFPTDEAQLSRSGSDLVLSFDDGGSITLSGFYDTYNQQDMPSFEVGGAEVAGADFFAALDQPDLMPAAGPQTAEDGTHYQEWSNMELLGGLDRLGGLDVGWPDGMPEPDTDGAAQGDYVDYPVTIFAMEDEPSDPDDPNGGRVPPGSPDPLDPDTPFYPDEPTDPEGDPANMSTNSAHLFVREEDLGGNMPPQDSGYLLIDAPNGVASIVIDGITVWQNGSMTGDTTIPTDEGKLEITGFDEATGRLDFTYTLEHATQEHAAEGADIIVQHPLPITVTDKDGSVGTGDITVTIKDDIPAAFSHEEEDLSLVEAMDDEAEGNIFSDDDQGADTAAITSVQGVSANESGNFVVTTEHGTLTVTPDGSYTYKLHAGGEATHGDAYPLAPGAEVTEVFSYTITDADGDASTASFSVHVSRPGIMPPSGGDTPPDGGEDIPPGGDTPPEGGETPPSDPIVPTPDPDPDGEPNMPSTDPFTIVVDEGDLSDGSGQHAEHGISGKGAFVVDLNGEAGDITMGGKSIVTDGVSQVGEGIALDAVHGVVVTVTGASLNGDGNWVVSYTYKLTAEQTHGDDDNTGAADSLAGQISIHVSDASGDTADGYLKVEVHDDGPSVTANDVAETVTVDFGADNIDLDGDGTASAAPAVEVFANAEDGTAYQWQSGETSVGSDLSLMEAGNKWTSGDIVVEKTADGYTFSFAKDADGVTLSDEDVTFYVKATDADGDSAGQSLTLTVPAITPTPTPDPDEPGPDPNVPTPDPDPDGAPNKPSTDPFSIIVDEGDLPDGSGQHAEHGISGKGAFVVDLNGEAGDITMGGKSIVTDGMSQVGGGIALDAVHGVVVTVTGAAQNEGGQWIVRYTYELTDEQDHTGTNKTGADDSLSGSIDILVTDVSGDTASGELTIEVHDDGPRVTAVSGQSVTTDDDLLGSAQSSDLLFDIDFGADNGTGSSVSYSLESYAGLDGIKALVDGQWQTVAVSRDGSVITGSVGSDNVLTITLNAAGKVQFEQNAALQHGENADSLDLGSVTIKATVTDADGDMSTASTTVALKVEDAEVAFAAPTMVVDTNVVDAAENLTYAFDDVNSGLLKALYDQSSRQSINIGNGVTMSTAEVQYGHSFAKITELLNPEGGAQAGMGTNPANWSQIFTHECFSVYDSIAKNADEEPLLHSFKGLVVTNTDPTPGVEYGERPTSSTATNTSHGAQDVSKPYVLVKKVALNENTGEYEFVKDGNGNHVYEAHAVGELCRTEYMKEARDENGNVITVTNAEGKDVAVQHWNYWTLGVHNSHTDTMANWNSRNWLEEVGYSMDGSTAEAIVYTLAQKAYNINIGLERCYSTGGSEKERLVMLFYDGDELVNYRIVAADKASGDLDTQGLEVYSKGFNKVVITTIHLGEDTVKEGENTVPRTPDDNNSDFTIKGVTFNSFVPAVEHVVNGQINASSADGIVGYGIDVAAWTAAGYHVVVMDDNTSATAAMQVKVYESATAPGSDGNPALLTLNLDVATGEWNFFQQTESLPSGLQKLFFSATDGDGDVGIQWVDISDNSYGTSFVIGTDAGETLGGTDGVDAMYGGAGDDVLDGGAGDDYLDGGAGSDLFVYDANDYIQGGDGIDFLLAGSGDTPDSKVQGVEVLVKGEGTEGLTSLTDMGVISAEGNTVTLDATMWEAGEDGTFVGIESSGVEGMTMSVLTGNDPDVEGVILQLNTSA